LPPTGDGMDADTTMLPPDDVLVARLRSVDEATFARLVDSWRPRMVHVARAHVSTSVSAAGVVQDTWLAVIRGVHGFEGRSSLRTTLRRPARSPDSPVADGGRAGSL
jgi:RNA polymerase sigma-70 factor (ECF subfamily)